ncbi:MAG: hypothetical protein LBU78_15225 [Microbacterium sp.]|jgi:hypothetical protein|nr:hypothetical protein [Microbacterium sp.]
MLPERLRPAVQRAVDALPEPVAERVLPWKRAAFRDAGVAAVPAAERRLLIGPVNSAGQAHAWTLAASAIPGTVAMNVMFRTDEDVFAFPADQSVSTTYAITNKRWQRAQRRAVSRGFSHVLIESGRRLLGPGGDVDSDIRALSDRGARVGLVWHGSDIRVPSVHAGMEPDSPFQDGRYADQARLEEITRRNHELIARSGLPSFVSTPDLLEFVPGATWLPVVIDADRWVRAAAGPVLVRERPVVVHAPSRAGLKGTALVSDLLRRLDAEGLIEYRAVEGVRAQDMPGVYGEADIVLDQFSLGIYGVAACEALAAGKLVISHVSEQVRGAVQARTGRELPVLEARAADLEGVLRGVLADRDVAQRFAERGPGFVSEVHDGARSRAALEPFLGAPTDSSSRAWET